MLQQAPEDPADSLRLTDPLAPEAAEHRDGYVSETWGALCGSFWFFFLGQRRNQSIALAAPRLMTGCWSQRPRCQAHVMEAVDNPLPRSPAALVLFIRPVDYCKAHAQRRCSREESKPHMVQKSSGRSAVRVPQTSRSAAAASHGCSRNPTWTRASTQVTTALLRS